MQTLIRAYGLFCKVENVFWGGGRRRSSLLGVPAGGRRRDPIDFREQVGIYILYRGHNMVYVGQAGRNNPMLLRRLNTHRRDNLAGRWDTFSWFGLRHVLKSNKLSLSKEQASADLRIVLDHMEGLLMAGAEPHLNRQGGRFGKGARRFYQYRDDRLPPTTEEMLKAVWKYVRKQQKKKGKH